MSPARKTDAAADAPTEVRGPRADTVEAVLMAAFRVLINDGAHALTPQRLHRETGVARTTIYRNWPDTADLMAAMLDRATGTADQPEFVGRLDADLEAAVDGLVFRFNNRPVRPLFAALIDHGRKNRADRPPFRSDPDLAADYIDRLLGPARRAIAEGIDRGELAPGPVEDLAVELVGELLSRHVLLGQVVTAEDGRRACARFLAAHGPGGVDRPSVTEGH